MDKTLYSYFLDYLSYIKQFNTDTVVLKKKQNKTTKKKTALEPNKQIKLILCC